MTPEAFRKQQERQRRKDAGLVRLEFWVRPEQVQFCKDIIKKWEPSVLDDYTSNKDAPL